MVMIAYPGFYDLPEWDIVYMILERKIDFLAFWPDCEVKLLKNHIFPPFFSKFAYFFNMIKVD
jgi:hypothetical protein